MNLYGTDVRKPMNKTILHIRVRISEKSTGITTVGIDGNG